MLQVLSCAHQSRPILPPLILAFQKGGCDRTELVKLLLRYYADPTATTYYGDTALITATKRGFKHAAQALLNHNRYIINQRGYNRRTALHHAVLRDDLYMVNLLLTYGADTELMDRYNRVPLEVSASIRAVEVAKALLRSACDPTPPYWRQAPPPKQTLINVMKFPYMSHLLLNVGTPVHQHWPIISGYLEFRTGPKALVTTPLSLQRLARIAVRAVLRRKALQGHRPYDVNWMVYRVGDDIGWPMKLQNFLKLSDFDETEKDNQIELEMTLRARRRVE
ncbi:hypothetical protein ACOMHN_057880 [Nucella lapillus]